MDRNPLFLSLPKKPAILFRCYLIVEKDGNEMHLYTIDRLTCSSFKHDHCGRVYIIFIEVSKLLSHFSRLNCTDE